MEISADFLEYLCLIAKQTLETIIYNLKTEKNNLRARFGIIFILVIKYITNANITLTV